MKFLGLKVSGLDKHNGSERFQAFLLVFSLGLKHNLLILAHGDLLVGEHGHTIIAATEFVACPDQQDLSF